MKTLDQWLDAYSVSHQNKTNQQLHKLCVPLIFFSVLGMLWDWQYQDVRAAYIAILLGMIFYATLGIRVFILMLVQVSLCCAILQFWTLHQGSIFWPNLGLFVFGWLGQFLGHKIEGKKPSFFEDLQFLLIGPVWVYAFAFRKK